MNKELNEILKFIDEKIKISNDINRFMICDYSIVGLLMIKTKIELMKNDQCSFSLTEAGY